MFTPSTLTYLLASDVLADHGARTRTSRSGLRETHSLRRTRRAAASRSRLPRGRIVPPFAH